MATVTKSCSSFSGLRKIGLESPLKKKAIITAAIVSFALDVQNMLPPPLSFLWLF